MSQARIAPAVFSHRRNPDHTFDSICHQCFRTIATETVEAELKQHEVSHNCVRFAQNAKPVTANTPYAANGTNG
ncbi:MAG: hypothetical protein V4734_03910 [Terriglobus sp.]